MDVALYDQLRAVVVTVAGGREPDSNQTIKELPAHLEKMALFAVNTGCRSGEIRQLKWDWEVNVPEIGDSVFIIPEEIAKNGQEPRKRLRRKGNAWSG